MSKSNWQALLTDAAKRYSVPGAVLAISRQGQTTALSAGVLSVDTGEPVRPDSLFQIGSIQKVLTASLVMTQVDAGRLELDVPIRHYLPEFRTSDPNAAKEITVRQLLCHTSGLDGDLMTDTGTGDDKLARFVDRCALLPQLFSPGESFSYSNSAYNLAGRLVEIVTGLTFEAALKKHIFEPLRLENSVSDLREMPGRSLAAGHTPDPRDPKKQKRLDTLFTLGVSASPAGSTTMMSGEDLISFARMHLADGRNADGEEVLSAGSVKSMREVQVRLPLSARGIDAWGLGWFYQDVDGIGLFGHDGATVGQCAYMRIDERSDTIGVLYANGGSMNDFFLEVFGETFDKIAGCDSPMVPQESDTQPEDLERFAGLFRNVGGDTTVGFDNGQLTRRGFWRFDDVVVDQPEVPLSYVGDNNFIWRLPDQQYPTITGFRDFDDDGQPQRIFSGLRWHNRVR